MKTTITFALFAVSSAFQVAPPSRSALSLQASQLDSSSSFEAIETDDARAKDCAAHMGKCSVAELKELREKLHKERVQSLMVDGVEPISAEKQFELRAVEEELAHQLSLLEKQTPDPNLFPEVEDSMQELPHLKDGTTTAVVEQQKKLLAVEEFLAEENIVETIAFCAFLGMVMMVPQLIH